MTVAAACGLAGGEVDYLSMRRVWWLPQLWVGPWSCRPQPGCVERHAAVYEWAVCLVYFRGGARAGYAWQGGVWRVVWVLESELWRSWGLPGLVERWIVLRPLGLMGAAGSWERLPKAGCMLVERTSSSLAWE